jgi:hypothetical protein
MQLTTIQCFRKSLLVKVKTGESDFEGHAKRHVQLLVELLGQFSNTVAEMCALGMTASLLSSVVGSLGGHVSDAAFGKTLLTMCLYVYLVYNFHL